MRQDKNNWSLTPLLLGAGTVALGLGIYLGSPSKQAHDVAPVTSATYSPVDTASVTSAADGSASVDSLDAILDSYKR